MHSLTKQQKIENLQEALKGKEEKAQKLAQEIENIKKKISRLQQD